MLTNRAIITNSFANKVAHIQQFVMANRDKKIMIFCETKRDAREFENLEFAKFLAIHGDLEQGARERAL